MTTAEKEERQAEDTKRKMDHFLKGLLPTTTTTKGGAHHVTWGWSEVGEWLQKRDKTSEVKNERINPHQLIFMRGNGFKSKEADVGSTPDETDGFINWRKGGREGGLRKKALKEVPSQ